MFPSGTRVKSAGIAAGAFALAGCATALSSFQPAHVPEKGHVQGELGVDISFSTGSIQKVIDAAEAADDAADQRRLTDAEKRILLEGAANLGLNPPALIPHVGAAYAPFERWEVGLRFATTGWRFGVRRQLLEQRDNGVDLTLGLGIGSAIFEPPIHSVLDKVEVDEFSRWNVDAAAALGQHGSWFRWWGGPRFVYSTTSQSMTVTLPGETMQGSVSGRAFYLGAHAGAALGYRTVFIGPELTLAKLIGDADVTALGSTTNVGVDSFVVYPAFAVMAEF